MRSAISKELILCAPEDKSPHCHRAAQVSASTELLRRAEAAGGIGAFEFDLVSKQWVWTPQLAVLFGLDPQTAPLQFNEPDDALKISSALETSKR
jgi:hypothetical protein